METDLRFFTNEPERDLYSRFAKILKTNTQFFDVLVGYFRTSGFYKLYSAMEDVEKIRILVGLNVDKRTVEIINAANGEGTLTVKQAKERFADGIAKEFEQSDTSAAIEQGVKTFIDWLKSGKLEMRMYVDAPIHAKVYIMRKDPEKADYFGSVITGSSNFSEAGLVNNLEFNVELKDKPDVKFALEKFEKLWADGVPITDEYIDTIEKKTWLRNDITPYEIFLKTLYEFFKEEINADKDVASQNLVPEGYMRLQYQLDAVVQAKKILKAYNGVFISDVVGLGKTYICAMLAKSLGRGKKLVICPPVLITNWENALQDYDVAAKVVSLGKLDSVINDPNRKNHDYEYVFVDEAHRFRNADTENFSKLHEICYGKKVILISATPINNYNSDIENQMYLFQPKHNCNIAGVKNLEGFFASLNGKLKGLEKGSPDFIEQERANSEEIRDRLLRHIMIRRTRHEIEQYYHDDLERQGLSFPQVGAPEKIIYTFDEQTDSTFTETMRFIKNFTYSRYKPLTYLKNTKPYATQLVPQQNMSGFMKGILVKRLESSFYAFRQTLGRFIESYENFIAMYNSGDIWISKKVDVYDLLDSGDIDKLMHVIEEEGNGYHFKHDDFKPKFYIDLTKDLGTLRTMKAMWDGITVDPKVDEFIADLRNNGHLLGNKKIIFTESKETAEYLYEKLKPLYGTRVAVFSGNSKGSLKRDIETSFDPKYREADRDLYDVLITTDVLAEGINLHRANAIINYDLPWNPTRIMQRVGRINRVSTEHDRIYVFNFFPTAQSSKEMSLTDRILEKLQMFHDTLGEDYKYLSDEEIVSSQKLFAALNSDIEDQEESTNPELAYLAQIRQIRDTDPELFQRIKHLPRKAKTGRTSSMVADDSTLTFIRKGALKEFFITGKGPTEQMSFIEAIKYLECQPEEKKISVAAAYYDQLRVNSDGFDDSLMQAEDETITAGRAKLKGNDSKVVKALQAVQMGLPTLTDDQEQELEQMKRSYMNGNIPQHITKAIAREIKNMEGSDLMELFYTIRRNIPDIYLHEQRDAVLNIEGVKQVVLSCYLEKANG